MNFSQFNFGLFSLKLYGFFLGAAFLVASWYWYKALQKEKLPMDFFVHHFWRWVLGGVLLGRLGALLVNPEVFETYGLFSFFAFWQGELHFVGFLLGFLLVLYTDLQQHEAKPWRWVDLGVIPFLLAAMIVDVAGWLTGAFYGTETSLFWGVKYEATGVKILTPVHPVTLYALFGHVLLWFAARHYQPRWKKSLGKLATFVAMGYFGLDIFWQFLRADDTLMLFGSWRFEQLLDLLLFAVLFYWWRRNYR